MFSRNLSKTRRSLFLILPSNNNSITATKSSGGAGVQLKPRRQHPLQPQQQHRSLVMATPSATSSTATTPPPPPHTAVVAQAIQRKLEETFQPTHLQVINESHRHNVYVANCCISFCFGLFALVDEFDGVVFWLCVRPRVCVPV
jgi:hypothetical protein